MINNKQRLSKLICLLAASLALGLAACGGGGGSSSGGGSNTSSSNFSQLTPANGLATPQDSGGMSVAPSVVLPDYYTSLYVATNGTVYAGTYNGFLYQTTNYNTWTQVGPNVGSAVVAVGGKNGNTFYYVDQTNSSTIYQIVDNAISPTSVVDTGNSILSLSVAPGHGSNGTAIFGDNQGQLNYSEDLIGFNTIGSATIVAPSGSTIAAPLIAVASTSNASSLHQGMYALAASSSTLPVFVESQAIESQLNNQPVQAAMTSQVWCVTNSQGRGVFAPASISIGSFAPSQSYTFSYQTSNGNESTVTVSLPQYITSLTVSPQGYIYAGTNLFNVYVANGCSGSWTQYNTQPLAPVSNGTVGVTNLAVNSNGALLVTVNNSESVLNVYQSNSAVN